MVSLLLVVFFVGIVVAALQPAVHARATTTWPVFQKPVMSKVERVLYARLVQAFPARLVLPQVQVCRFVEVRPVRGARAWKNRYDRLSVDFALCGADSTVDLVVELDDASHATATAQARDRKKDDVLRAAGIRIVRLHVRSLPSVRDLDALLFPQSPDSAVAHSS